MALGAVISALIGLAQFLSQGVLNQEQIISFWSQNVLPWFSGQTFGNLVAQNPSWLVEIQGKSFLRAFGLFPDPHMLAFFLGLTFPFVLAAVFLGQKFKAGLFAILCLMTAVLALTFSRGGYLGFFVAFLFLIFFVWPGISRAGKGFLKNGALVLLVLFFLAGGLISARFFSSFNLNEGSNQGRLAIWRESFNVFLKNPILGVGLGNYPLTTDPYIDYRSPVTSHNLYLDILAETGIFGLAAWLWFIAAAAKAAWRKMKSVQKEDWIVGLGALGALVYFSVHSFFETAIFNPTVLAFLMIVGGLAASSIQLNPERR